MRTALALGLVCAACAAGGEPAAPEPPPPAAPRAVTLEARDLLAAGSPLVERAELVLDGRALALPRGSTRVELAPGRHALFARDPRYRPDLFTLRAPGEGDPRAQAAGSERLDFDVLPGDTVLRVGLVSRAFDVRWLASLLDGGVSRRWRGPVDLHVDLSRSASGFALPIERVPEIVAFADSALAELSARALRVGRVTTGTGRGWRDFLERGRPGAITLHFDHLTGIPGRDAYGWGVYRPGPAGTIEWGNVILDVEVVRVEGSDFRPSLGHELGHALSLQHPDPCRQWSRMSAGGEPCRAPPAADVAPGAFWGTADREAGRLIHAFRPGTEFGRLGDLPVP